MTCKQPSNSTNTWLLCSRKSVFFNQEVQHCGVFSDCATPVVFVHKESCPGKLAEGLGARFSCGGGSGMGFHSQQHLPHLDPGCRLSPAHFMGCQLQTPQPSATPAPWPKLRKKPKLCSWAGELRRSGHIQGQSLNKGGKSCVWEIGHGMKGQEETETGGDEFFQLSWLCCGRWIGWLNGSCISLCLLSKQAVLRRSMSLKVIHLNKIFFNRSFVVGAGA